MAINGQTNVDIAGMLAAQPHFEKALGDTTTAYNGMNEQAQTLESSWTGPAAQQFIPALQQWLDNCNTVRAQLQIVYEKLEANTGHYDQVHTQTIDAATAVKQAMAAGLPGF
ncbi:WXG100 family type VII secretion target [Streptantibioticus ferralitis]|uniref:WXG100 family type VII secretion target n=1 Tax=Streptantibioticus ferralitis TaxID=236510 RepID=A0ABT5Z4M1_9ACTN|nr:WXG100 family type VII secretion target [Streptantibioticus ferralitis]MDF2258776.1 WXG100 family type VII secretion target [Streptantibioticus ferralitis]